MWSRRTWPRQPDMLFSEFLGSPCVLWVWLRNAPGPSCICVASQARRQHYRRFPASCIMPAGLHKWGRMAPNLCRCTYATAIGTRLHRVKRHRRKVMPSSQPDRPRHALFHHESTTSPDLTIIRQCLPRNLLKPASRRRRQRRPSLLRPTPPMSFHGEQTPNGEDGAALTLAAGWRSTAQYSLTMSSETQKRSRGSRLSRGKGTCPTLSSRECLV